MRFQRSSDALGRLVTLVPSLRHVMPGKTGYKECVETSIYAWEFVKEKVQEHLKTLDKEFQRDYVDTYIDKMKSEKAFSGNMRKRNGALLFSNAKKDPLMT